jgi:hypothetical protein
MNRKKRIIKILLSPVLAAIFLMGWVLYYFGNKSFDRVTRVKKHFSYVFHIAGISSLLGGSLVMCWIFYTIAGLHQTFQLYENTAWIRYSESVLVGIGVIYAIWLLITFINRASK